MRFLFFAIIAAAIYFGYRYIVMIVGSKNQSKYNERSDQAKDKLIADQQMEIRRLQDDLENERDRKNIR